MEHVLAFLFLAIGQCCLTYAVYKSCRNDSGFRCAVLRCIDEIIEIKNKLNEMQEKK